MSTGNIIPSSTQKRQSRESSYSNLSRTASRRNIAPRRIRASKEYARKKKDHRSGSASRSALTYPAPIGYGGAVVRTQNGKLSGSLINTNDFLAPCRPFFLRPCQFIMHHSHNLGDFGPVYDLLYKGMHGLGRRSLRQQSWLYRVSGRAEGYSTALFWLISSDQGDRHAEEPRSLGSYRIF